MKLTLLFQIHSALLASQIGPSAADDLARGIKHKNNCQGTVQKAGTISLREHNQKSNRLVLLMLWKWNEQFGLVQ